MTLKKLNELIERFFTKTQLYYVRKRDGYRFDGEEVHLSINHFIETGQEP